MHIWLMTVGEPLPTDGGNDRLHRVGTLANIISGKGHEVVWWSSTFDHVRKKQRYQEDTLIEFNSNLSIRLLHGITYKRNISIQRIINHIWIARKFAQLAPVVRPRPDIILCSLPTIELSYQAALFGEESGIPVVLDMRDQWPDIFLDLAPSWARIPTRIMLDPMYRQIRQACTKATAITGITPQFVQWGLGYAGREAGEFDRDFPLGYSAEEPEKKEVNEANLRWRKLGIGEDSAEFICCFFGTIGRQFDLEPVIQAARMLGGGERKFRFVICGDGEKLTYYKNLAKDSGNIIFPGWVGRADIWTLLRKSSVGLAPYNDVPNFTLNLPNKIIEYFSAGLPILSGIEGVVGELMAENGCGLTYEPGNHKDLVARLIELYDNPDSRNRQAENAHNLFHKRFTAEKVYGEMVEYLQQVVESHNAP